MARPSRGSNDHVKMAVPSLVGEDNMVSPISAFVLNTLIKSFFSWLHRQQNTWIPLPELAPNVTTWNVLRIIILQHLGMSD